jgi:hypothetical protein
MARGTERLRAARLLALVFLCLLASGSSAEPLWGQGGGAPHVHKKKSLKFKEVIAGATYTVDPLNKDAGSFEVHGNEGAEILISFILPFELIGPDDDVVPIYFGEGYGILSPDGKQPETGGRFDPRISITFVSPPTDGKGDATAYIWLGGTVNPAFSARAGKYKADIVMEASYTGN